MKTSEESEILKLLRKVDTREIGFKKLIQTYKEPLYWHIRRMVQWHEDADDVLQNTFIKVFNAIDKFRGQSTLYTWLFRIASNESISHLRKRKRRRLSDTDISDFGKQLKEDPYFDADAVSTLFQQALERLPARQKLVFNLRYFEELTYAQISEILEVSEGSLKASYHYASKKIESFLKENEIMIL